MARNQRELQDALASALDRIGFLNAREHFVLQIQWQGHDLVVRARCARFRVSVKNKAQYMNPTVECRYENADTRPGAELRVWVEQVCAPDVLALLYTEVVKCHKCKGVGATKSVLMTSGYAECVTCNGRGWGGDQSFDWPAEWPKPLDKAVSADAD